MNEMEKEHNDLISRLENEYNDLMSKIEKVSNILNDKTTKITAIQKELLSQQKKAMIEYASILKTRIELLKANWK